MAVAKKEAVKAIEPVEEVEEEVFSQDHFNEITQNSLEASQAWEDSYKAELKVVSDGILKPFTANQIRQRTGANNMRLDYVSGTDYIYRLIAVTDNQFSFTLIGAPQFEKMTEMTTNKKTGVKEPRDIYLCTVCAEVTVPGLGTRAGIGVQKLTSVSEDLVKGALTDAFKNALKYFGMGLHLYGENPEGENDPNF